jgi:xanthine dehydrogenase small subunit
VPVGELHGKHLVTIEGLNLGKLSPVQQAIVDKGATQCGFCTPGIVVSLTHLLMTVSNNPSSSEVKTALSGHLCRCTGYGSLKRCCDNLPSRQKSGDNLDHLISQGILPAYFNDIPAKLRNIHGHKPHINGKVDQALISGGTDIYLQRGDDLLDVTVQPLNLRSDLKRIEKKNGNLRVGALTTFEDFSNHKLIRAAIPDIKEYMHVIASLQIRNRATLGGNIVNASPIGDMTILLLALDATLHINDGRHVRKVALKQFFQGYKQFDLRERELLCRITFEASHAGGYGINFQKVSKRRCLDIASVNSAICVRGKAGVIDRIGLAFGGVAPVPLFMHKTCDYLKGEIISMETVRRAIAIAQSEIAPISDVRGSATYKRLLVRQITIKHFARLFPDRISMRDFCETH